MAASDTPGQACGCYTDEDHKIEHLCQAHWDEMCRCPKCGKQFDDPVLRVMHEDDEHPKAGQASAAIHPAGPMTDVQAQARIVRRLKKCGGCATNGPACNSVWPNQPENWCVGCLIDTLAAPVVPPVRLSPEDSRVFAEALVSPPAPNDRLKHAAAVVPPRIVEWPGVAPDFVRQWNEMALELHRTKAALVAAREERDARAASERYWFKQNMETDTRLQAAEASLSALRHELALMTTARDLLADRVEALLAAPASPQEKPPVAPIPPEPEHDA